MSLEALWISFSLAQTPNANVLSSKMSPVVGGSKTFWTEFIQTYESLPTLWDVKSDCYKNRNLKNEAYEKLATKLQEIEPNANREVVRRKINSLRCSYRRELNKIKESYNTADVNDFYRTSLWYFDLLGFLREQENLLQDPCMMDNSNKVNSPSPAPSSTSTPPPAPVPASTSQAVAVQPPPAKKFKSSTNPAPYRSPYPSSYSKQYSTSHENSPPPHQSQRSNQDREVHICSSCPCIAAQESEYDKIGKAWASELQKMTPEQQIYAKRAIAEIIFEGQLGSLHRDSVTINHIEARVVDETPTYVIEKEEPDFDC